MQAKHCEAEVQLVQLDIHGVHFQLPEILVSPKVFYKSEEQLDKHADWLVAR